MKHEPEGFCAVSEPRCEYSQQVNEIEMQDEVEERHTPENRQRIRDGKRMPIEPRQHDERRSDGHQQKIERSRIFGAVQKRQYGENGGAVRGPGRRISVAIYGSNHEERGRES